MVRLAFPITRVGLTLEALVGVDGSTMAALQQAGQPITPPVHVRALIDTGTDITAVSAPVIRRLAIPQKVQTFSQTASGLVRARLFNISFSVPDPLGIASPFVLPQLLVMELTAHLPDIDVLIGLDVVASWQLNIDGPARSFVVEY